MEHWEQTLENASFVGQALSIDIIFIDLSSTVITLDSTVAAADPASYGESILLESGEYDFIITEESPSIGDGVVDKTAQNELFDTLDDVVLDFSESNPFGDAGVPN